MFDIEDIFKKDNTEYKNNINPIEDYVEQVSAYISKFENIEKNEIKKYVKQTLKNNKKVTNPEVVFRERDIHGNVRRNRTSLLGYINYIKQTNDILVPSFTVYFNPKKKKSLHSEFITENVRERSKHKKLAFKYKMEGDINKFNYHNTLQKTMKIFNNSLSGAYGSSGTILYNPSSHYTLTSITRCVSGIGNAISESMIAGNRHYRDYDVTVNHLLAIINNTDYDLLNKVIKKYNLHIPTTDEIMNDVIIKNIYRYWRDSVKEEQLRKFIDNLNPLEKAIITYHNSLYHLRLYNDTFMRNIFDELLDNRDVVLKDDPYTILKKTPEWVLNMVVHIKVDVMKGVKLVIDELDKIRAVELAKTAYKAMSIFDKLEDFIKVFFVTNIFPPSISYIRDMVRDVIVLSDTDSTCATYQDWGKWYIGNYNINTASIGVSAIVMTFNTQAIDHYIKTLGVNMNIEPNTASILKMKNEFFWDVFVNTDVSKHYYAQVQIQEGNAFKEPDLEVKGVHLIASQVYEDIRKTSKWMMKDIMETVNRNEKIELNKYLEIVKEKELMIKNEVLNGNPDVLKLQKIKEEKAYKEGGSKSPYLHYMLWQELFADKYGQAPDPTYIALKIPTTINSKKDFEEWLETLDEEMADRFRKFLKKHNKTEIKTFNFPLVNVKSKGLPKEILNIIDINRTINDNCKVLYLILNSLGFYLPPDKHIIDL